MYLDASVFRYLAGGIYRRYTTYTCIQVCAGTGTGTATDFRACTGRFGKFGTPSIRVPETSVSAVRP